MCTGYAILEISPKANPYTPLTHKITCRKSNLGRFYATWKGTPDYCQYCHVQDHTTDACPNAETGERIWKDDGTDIKHVKGISSYLHFLAQKKRREEKISSWV